MAIVQREPLVLPMLEDRSVILQPACDKLAPEIFTLMNDPTIMRYVLPPAKSVEEVAQTLVFVSSLGIHTVGWWAIISRQNSSMVGIMMYFGVNHMNRYCSIAYLVDPSHRRRGYAYHSAILTINFLLGEMKLNRVEAEVETENNASINLLVRLGFVCESSKLRQRVFLSGAYRDVGMYSLLSEDWKLDCHNTCPDLR